MFSMEISGQILQLIFLNNWMQNLEICSHVMIYQNKIKKYDGTMPYTETFGAVAKGKPLLYLNSLLQVSFALNMGSFFKYKSYL